MPAERTIRTAVECEGVGLHSGVPVKLRLLPAPAGSGVVFRRTDLDNFAIEAVSRNVAKVSYATSLMKKGVLISTTEHLLAALIGVGIDNVVVELDNLEVPILDGSARPFADMIMKAGLKPQRRRRQYLRILRHIELRTHFQHAKRTASGNPGDQLAVPGDIRRIGHDHDQIADSYRFRRLLFLHNGRRFGSRDRRQAGRPGKDPQNRSRNENDDGT